MLKIDKVNAMQAAAAGLHGEGRRVALVPTAGALHAGHASLIRLARETGAAVVVSAFVNPLQFGPSEDFAKYPRNPSGDASLCEKEGADVLFAPVIEEMYPRGFSTHLQEELISKHLCGVARPALFRGLLTCWIKLINIVRPDTVVMGERDAQQVAVVRKAVADLLLPINILTGPAVRDADGLVVSARNSYLTPSQREEALAVYATLRRVKEMVEAGVKSADRLVAEATHLIATKRRLRVVYIAVVDRHTIEQLREVTPGQCLIAISYWVDEVRLTDSMPL